jgi:hypothetical protein
MFICIYMIVLLSDDEIILFLSDDEIILLLSLIDNSFINCIPTFAPCDILPLLLYNSISPFDNNIRISPDRYKRYTDTARICLYKIEYGMCQNYLYYEALLLLC